jgi:Tfp pilus assembly protein PilO
MSSLRNNPILVAVIAAALATAAFWFLALSPKRQEAADLQSQISAKQGELETSRQQIATYERDRQTYKASYTKLARLGKAVPADDDIRSLLVQLDSAGKSTNVDFTSLSVGGSSSSSSASSSTAGTEAKTATGLAPAPGSIPVGTTGISAMPFALQFSGSYFNLTDFFNRLDHFVAVHNRHVKATGRLLRVETISLAPAADGYPRMTALVNAASYLVAPTAPADGTTPPSTTAPAPSTSSATSTTTTATITGAAR